MSRNTNKFSRRSFLHKSAVAASLGASLASSRPADARIPTSSTPDPADYDDYDFLLPRICNNNPDWNFGPGGEKNLLEQFGAVMRCKVKLQPNVKDLTPGNGTVEHYNALVDLTNVERMRKYPMLFMMGTGGYTMRGDRARNLKDYLLSGGFILMDECGSPRRRNEFYHSSLRVMQAIFPESYIRVIPEEHEVYRTVYNISEPGFRRWKRGGLDSPGNTGVFIGDRLAAFLCDADLHCGWMDPRMSRVYRASHQESIMTGINILTYVLSH